MSVAAVGVVDGGWTIATCDGVWVGAGVNDVAEFEGGHLVGGDDGDDEDDWRGGICEVYLGTWVDKYLGQAQAGIVPRNRSGGGREEGGEEEEWGMTEIVLIPV